MLSAYSDSARRAGLTVARFLTEYPGHSVQIDWSDGAVLIQVDHLDVEAEDIVFFQLPTTPVVLDTYGSHAVS